MYRRVPRLRSFVRAGVIAGLASTHWLVSASDTVHAQAHDNNATQTIDIIDRGSFAQQAPAKPARRGRADDPLTQAAPAH